jgi:hypothetical protein
VTIAAAIFVPRRLVTSRRTGLLDRWLDLERLAGRAVNQDNIEAIRATIAIG